MNPQKKTPVTPNGLRQYDHLPPAEAAKRAWAEVGTNPTWDAHAKEQVRELCPLLARALDRMVDRTASKEPHK